MRWFLLLAVLAVGGACSRERGDARAPESSPTPNGSAAMVPPSASTASSATVSAPADTSAGAPASVASSAQDSAGEPAPIAAWTDPPIVQALTSDCKFKPPDRPAGEVEPSPLSCASGLYEQSCAVDPCYASDQTQCKPRCEKTCNTCSDRCSTSCSQCKTHCNDDACRRACAGSCATCKQNCLSEKDRCASGTCAAEYKTCTEQLVKRWKQSGCEKACNAYQECADKCQNAASCAPGASDQACEQCSARCTATLRRNCAANLVEICLFNGAGPSDAP